MITEVKEIDNIRERVRKWGYKGSYFYHEIRALLRAYDRLIKQRKLET